MRELEKEGRQVADLSMEEKFYYFLEEAEAIDHERLAYFLNDKVFEKAFHEIERMNWSEADFNDYEAITKANWDATNKLATAKAEGMKEGKIEIIKSLVKEGIISQSEAKKRLKALEE